MVLSQFTIKYQFVVYCYHGSSRKLIWAAVFRIPGKLQLFVHVLCVLGSSCITCRAQGGNHSHMSKAGRAVGCDSQPQGSPLKVRAWAQSQDVLYASVTFFLLST